MPGHVEPTGPQSPVPSCPREMVPSFSYRIENDALIIEIAGRKEPFSVRLSQMQLKCVKPIVDASRHQKGVVLVKIEGIRHVCYAHIRAVNKKLTSKGAPVRIHTPGDRGKGSGEEFRFEVVAAELRSSVPPQPSFPIFGSSARRPGALVLGLSTPDRALIAGGPIRLTAPGCPTAQSKTPSSRVGDD